MIYSNHYTDVVNRQALSCEAEVTTGRHLRKRFGMSTLTLY